MLATVPQTDVSTPLRLDEALVDHLPVGLFQVYCPKPGHIFPRFVSGRCREYLGTADLVRILTEMPELADPARVQAPLAWHGEVVAAATRRHLRVRVTVSLRGTPFPVVTGTIEDVSAEWAEVERLQKTVQAIGALVGQVAVSTPAEDRLAPGARAFLRERLSCREVETAQLLLDGLSNKEIASRLCISESTVKKHIGSIFEKLEVNSRAELFRLDRSSSAG